MCVCVCTLSDTSFSDTISGAAILQSYGVKKPVCYIRDNEVISIFLYHVMIVLIGVSLSEPHINSTAMHIIYCMYVCMVQPSSTRYFIDSVQGRMQSFVLKSLRSKTTATVCSNLARLCNTSLVVSC